MAQHLIDQLTILAKKSKSKFELYYQGDTHREEFRWSVYFRYPVKYQSSPCDSALGENLEEILTKVLVKVKGYLLRPRSECPKCNGTGQCKSRLDYESTTMLIDSLCDCNFPEEPKKHGNKLRTKHPNG